MVKQMSRWIFVVTMILVATGCHRNFIDPDTGVISGTVIDNTGQSISAADISLSPTSNVARTGTIGEFKFSGLAANTYIVSASKAGYVSAKCTVAVTNNHISTCQLVLVPSEVDDTVANKATQFNGIDNGSGSYIKVDHSSDLNLNGHSYTIEAWFNPASILRHSSWGQWILNKGIDNSTNEYLLGIDQYGKICYWCSYTGTIWSRTSLRTNEWAHVALVVDESQKRATLYINGVEDGSMNYYGASPVATTTPLFIGARNYFGQNFGVENWDGAIDEVRIWSTARSVEQINTNKGLSIPGTTSGLVAYWKFNESSSTEVVDETGHGHTGTCINGVRHIKSTAPVY